MTIFVLLWVSVILASILKKHRLLIILSSLCFLIIGVIYNSPVGIYSLFSLANSFHLLPLLALMSVLLYKNVYCAHICPFVFLQRIAGRLPIKKRRSPVPVLRSGKYILLVVALASLLMGKQLFLEPYAYLFSRKLIWWIYLLPLAMLGISLFIPRFWCRLFCPMGAAMQIGREIKKCAQSAEEENQGNLNRKTAFFHSPNQPLSLLNSSLFYHIQANMEYGWIMEEKSL